MGNQCRKTTQCAHFRGGARAREANRHSPLQDPETYLDYPHDRRQEMQWQFAIHLPQLCARNQAPLDIHRVYQMPHRVQSIVRQCVHQIPMTFLPHLRGGINRPLRFLLLRRLAESGRRCARRTRIACIDGRRELCRNQRNLRSYRRCGCFCDWLSKANNRNGCRFRLRRICLLYTSDAADE